MRKRRSGLLQWRDRGGFSPLFPETHDLRRGVTGRSFFGNSFSGRPTRAPCLRCSNRFQPYFLLFALNRPRED